MKRWLWWFFLTIGIVMLLWISHRPVQSPVHPLDRSVLPCSSAISVLNPNSIAKNSHGPTRLLLSPGL
jgi:hypothetical protein